MPSLIYEISQAFGIEEGLVASVVSTAPYRYKVYPVPKKGSKGSRMIAQPAREVKAVQKFLTKVILNKLPIHPAAKAYVAGSSIRSNALPHVENRYLLKMDFQGFFPSIHPQDLIDHINNYLPGRFSADDLRTICQICFWKRQGEDPLQLSIGGPSSPFISNTLLYDFDQRMSEICEAKHVVFTRYADDLTFSTNAPNLLRDIEVAVCDLLQSIDYPRLTLNDDKTVHTSKRHKRRVTGLILSSQNEISLGRDRKRYISLLIDHAINKNDLCTKDSQKLIGLIAFANDVEPDFLERLKRKYGEDVLVKIGYERNQ